MMATGGVQRAASLSWEGGLASKEYGTASVNRGPEATECSFWGPYHCWRTRGKCSKQSHSNSHCKTQRQAVSLETQQTADNRRCVLTKVVEGGVE